MKTIIFKSDKNAKVYNIISEVKQGVYGAGEIISTVKTDDINKLNDGSQYKVFAKEIK